MGNENTGKATHKIKDSTLYKSTGKCPIIATDEVYGSCKFNTSKVQHMNALILLYRI